jgi:hypothetical protein
MNRWNNTNFRPNKIKRKTTTENSKKDYFTSIHEKAIIDFQDDRISWGKRQKLYNEFIYPVFNEMTSIMINTFNFHYTGEDRDFLIAETQAHLYESLNRKMYKKENGDAFSYFSVAIKRFLIQKQKKNQDKIQKYGLESIDSDESYYIETYYEELTDFDTNEFIKLFSKWLENNILLVVENEKEDELLIAECILTIIKDERIVINNRKILYQIIKQATLKENYKISKVLNTMKKYFIFLKHYYIEYGNFDVKQTYELEANEFFKKFKSDNDSYENDED